MTDQDLIANIKDHIPPYGSYADKRDLLAPRSTDSMALGIFSPSPSTSNISCMFPLYSLYMQGNEA